VGGSKAASPVVWPPGRGYGCVGAVGHNALVRLRANTIPRHRSVTGIPSVSCWRGLFVKQACRCSETMADDAWQLAPKLNVAFRSCEGLRPRIPPSIHCACHLKCQCQAQQLEGKAQWSATCEEGATYCPLACPEDPVQGRCPRSVLPFRRRSGPRTAPNSPGRKAQTRQGGKMGSPFRWHKWLADDTA
jgi:hypothetical protein